MTPEELRSGLDAIEACLYWDTEQGATREDFVKAKATLAALRRMRVVAWYSGTATALEAEPPFPGAVPLFTLEPPT